jgi:hypothetical protein
MLGGRQSPPQDDPSKAKLSQGSRGNHGLRLVSYAAVLPRAVVGDYRACFQRRPNLPTLLSAQGRELESVLCSQGANNFCRDHLSVAVRQRDFERYGLAQYQSFGNECPQPTFAEIACPAL